MFVVASPLPRLEVTVACKWNQRLLLTCTRAKKEMLSEKGEEIGCQTTLTPAVNIHKKVPVTLKQSRAKRPLLRNSLHALVHVSVAGVYTAPLGGNTQDFQVSTLISCVWFQCTTELFYSLCMLWIRCSENILSTHHI